MSSELRERKKGASGRSEQPQTREEEDTKKSLADQGPVDLEPDIRVAGGIMVMFFVVLGIFVYYKIDNRDDGPFAVFVNKNILEPLEPWVVPKNRYQQKVGL